jgi:CubicO group peptidase (beta-lactamase class C family)
MKKIFTILFCILSLHTFGQSIKNLTPAKPEEAGISTDRLTRIDAMLNEHVSKKWIPGAVVLIARNGKIIYHKAYGYSDAEKQTALKKDDIFRIASQTKAITSLAVMMLFEEGKFLLDEPISKYIPEFKNPKVLKTFNEKDSTYTTEPAKGEITIRHLLTHSSGIDYASIGSKEFKAIYAKAGVPSGIGNDNMVLADKIKILATLPIKHNPGEQWTYGLNTDVLGYLVEVLSGTSFDQFLRTKIFQPLGMNDTYFYLPKEKHSRLVKLYQSKDGLIAKVSETAYDGVNPNYPNLNGKYFSGGAGLSSTVEDYAKFLQLFLNKGEYNGVHLLSRKTVELMLTNQLQPPITTQFGLGFGLETDKNDYQSIFSLGSFSWGGAFNTHYWADPKEKLIGLIFTNMYNTPYWNIGDKYKVLTYQAIID